MKAVVLIGPTGAGKTDLSLKLTENNFEIISSDSVQIYRYMDIGSCKPTKEQRDLAVHHLVDIVDPDFAFTAGEFCREAENACKKIARNNRYPLFVGGCAFYINAFFKGLSAIPQIPGAIRMQLNEEYKERGLLSLYNELKDCDKIFADKIHKNDKQRVLRGLEVYRGTGKPLSNYYIEKKGKETSETLYLGISIDREELRDKIDKRVDLMMEDGFLDEVVKLREIGYGPELKSMRSIGYFELNEYLDGNIKFEEAIEKIKTETKRYAKRQMTWYRRNKDIHWFESSQVVEIKELLSNWLIVVNRGKQ